MLTAKIKGRKGIHTAKEAAATNDLDWLCTVCEEPVVIVTQTSGRRSVRLLDANASPQVLLTQKDRFLDSNRMSFAHQENSSHPVRPGNNPYRNNAFDALHWLLTRSNYAIKTDQLTEGYGDFGASDISVFDPAERKRTEIFIQPDKFRLGDLEQTMRQLSARQISTMVVFSAWGSVFNPNGVYLRPAKVVVSEDASRRRSRYHAISGNEKDVVELLGTPGMGNYFRHSSGSSHLAQVVFGEAAVPIIPMEQSDNDLQHIIMRTPGYAALVNGKTPELVSLKQAYENKRQVKRNGMMQWETDSGIKDVYVILGNGKIKRILKDRKEIREETPVTELKLMYRSNGGYDIAFPMPARHLEAKRASYNIAPVQLGLKL